MASEICVHACHILKRAETCLVAIQNIPSWRQIYVGFPVHSVLSWQGEQAY